MADFESCYFCGTGPAGSLQEYAVVPETFDPAPDEQQSVVLCASCREKLTAVMQSVVEAAEGADAAASLGESDSLADATAGDPPAGDATDAADAATPTAGVTADSAGDEEPAAGGDEGATADPGGDGAAGGGEDLIGHNSEAYRKVIRLLQNREFPVDRREIEQVAANAYQLDPGECSDAIDAVIQKGLLVEEEGLLRRP